MATYTKIEDHYFWVHIGKLFRLERIAKCSYFILSMIHVHKNIKFLLICSENDEILCCQFDYTIEVYFLLGIHSWGLRSEWVNVCFCHSQNNYQWIVS